MGKRTGHPQGRAVTKINDGWKFLKLSQKDSLPGIVLEAADFDDSGLEEVSLPHTWNDIDGADGRSGRDKGGEDYYRGLGGYRKRIVFSGQEHGGKSVFIEFEGANTVTELFVNGTCAGRHEGGYAAFRFDITPFLCLGKENVLAVKVDNAPTDVIAPITDQGDFTKMGGIYRGVKLIAVPPVHIDLMDFGSSGIYVTPENIGEDHADLDIQVRLANDASEGQAAHVVLKIFDMDEKPVAQDEKDIFLPAGGKAAAGFAIPLENPVLWNGAENPYLYTAEIMVEAGDNEFDNLRQAFGIRTYHIDPENGFFLNGKYLDLRGVNYHQDSFENGWAMTDEQRGRDYRMIRAMGATSVRMAHYQHGSYEYELCDRLGLTVWTEIGIVNKMSADDSDAHAVAPGFADNAAQQLTELIRQNYNHPSVIVWGISNELFQMTDEIYRIFTGLYELAKKEDKTRLVTFADAQFWGRFLELPADVVGYNRYFGWYHDAGGAEQFGAWLDLYHETKERRPICVSEYGGGAAMSQYKDNVDWKTEIEPWGKRHYQNYQSAMHEAIWAQFAARRYLWGKYIWCMFDFASDGREEGDTRGQNDKGLVTRTRIPKDSFYFYKSVWNPEPMVHLTEKGFVLRPAAVPQVKAYANGERAELFVNGHSKGSIRYGGIDGMLPTVLIWKDVAIAAGTENEIVVKAFFADGSVLEDRAFWMGE
ncbi:MAG: glycoside hydrolase family 2 protein [Lachnospiraceae bacterium]|nr:glycoside hydrolase family 2 protein [Lachnospiraceae bacterium]